MMKHTILKASEDFSKFVWGFSEPLKYNPDWDAVPPGESTGKIKGCLAEAGGLLYSIMRYDTRKLTPDCRKVVYQVDTAFPSCDINRATNPAAFAAGFVAILGK